MAFKNTYTREPLDNMIRKIQQTLVAHKAKKIMFDYSDDGVIVGLSFGIMVNDQMLAVKLPAKIKECEAILIAEKKLTLSKKDHALRVAWANIRDWVDSQMAMVDLDMAKMEEVFLPYIMDGNKTIFELYESKFNALPERSE